MPNNLATLNTKLATALRDTAGDIWDTGERDDLLTWAAASLWPRVSEPVREVIPLVQDQATYSTTVIAQPVRVDLLDESSNLLYPLMPGTWEWYGDYEVVGGQIYINPGYAITGRSVRIHGYGPIDLVSNLPSNRMVPLVLAIARAEALRRAAFDRAKFERWKTINQTSNVTMTELIGMLTQAEQDEERLRQQIRTFRKPVPARVGR